MTARSRVASAAAAALVMVFGGCGVLGLGVKNLSYDEAQAELRGLVDEGLAAGTRGGALDLPKSEVYDHDCGESDQVEAYPEYSYTFPLEKLGPDPDSFAVRVADYWKTQGFELFPDEADPGIKGSFAEKDEFNLQVFVNRITDEALVGGSGPCVSKPE